MKVAAYPSAVGSRSGGGISSSPLPGGITTTTTMKKSFVFQQQRGKTTAASEGGKRRTKKKGGRRTTKIVGTFNLRKNPCFRAFLFLISVQTFVLLLVVLFVGDDFPQAISSRAQTLLLIRDYYVDHFRQRDDTMAAESASAADADDALLPGIVLADDDATSQNPKTEQEIQEVEDHTSSGGDDDLDELEDHLANQTEERLDQLLLLQQQEHERQSVVPSHPQPAIDNYYERQELYQSSINNVKKAPFQFLIVGGSDGSGTRAFVTALGKLGVPMIVDDLGTMDVHGKPLFHKQGWPPLVQLVLNHTHTANYQVEDLPSDVRTTILEELTKLKKDLIRRGIRYNKKELTRQKNPRKLNHYPNNNQHHRNQYLRRPVSAFEQHHRILMEDHQQQHQDEAAQEEVSHEVVDEEDPDAVNKALNRSELVQFGWKAPVSMLLLPFLREVFGPIKFLHVVRDGRDVALSANQSPVKKFYNSYNNDTQQQQQQQQPLPDSTTKTNNDTTTMNIRAMELWNDWNLQVLEYETNNVNKDFDYLIMRTEDLLDPEKKFQSLQQLAHFIGSRHSLQDLCCQSQQAVVDMGESSPNIGDGKKGVRGRRNHFPSSRKHVYDRLVAKGQQRTDYFTWLQNRKKNNQHPNNNEKEQEEEQEEELVEQVHDVLASAGEGGSEPLHQHHHRPVMGADPILGFAHGPHDSGDWNSNAYFDTEEGRHRNWHHNQMDTGSLVETARERRMQDLRKRNERYKGLANRVAANLQKQHQHQHQHQQHRRPLERPSSPRHHPRNHHQHQLARPADKSNNDNSGAPQQHADEHRRRLLSSFNKLQIRHNPYRPKKKKEEGREKQEQKRGTSEHASTSENNNSKEQHHQFKPRRHAGDAVFHEHTTGDTGKEPVSGKPGTAWSLSSSISQFLGFASRQQTPTKSDFEHAVVKKFQYKPLEEHGASSEEEQEDGSVQGNKKKKKKPGNVKARYGKWVAYLQDKPELSQQLHETGAKALEAFGYEPSAPFLDTSGIDTSFQCGSSVVCEDNTAANEEDKQRAAWRERRDHRLLFVH